MAKFLSDDNINSELNKLLREAEEYIVLVSPFIKLHPKIKSILEIRRKEPSVELIVVFGKNEDNVQKSMSKEDFEFFKSFPSVTVLYNSRLHAKYYASEKSAILTSMNLYDYSQNNNIEFGILLKSSKINNIKSSILGEMSIDEQASLYFFESVIEQSEVLFEKEAIFEKGFLGFGAKYIESKILVDETAKFFKGETTFKKQPTFNRWKNQQQPQTSNKPNGYCIRTGVQIPFNSKHPMCDDA